MTADSDLIHRHEALAEIRKEMKKAYTPAGRRGFKQSFDAIRRLPAVQIPKDTVAHSHWFVNAGWYFCDRCGGRSFAGIPHFYCPHCGAKMDEMNEIE